MLPLSIVTISFQAIKCISLGSEQAGFIIQIRPHQSALPAWNWKAGMGSGGGRTELLMSGYVEMSLCVFAFDTAAYKPPERMCPTFEPRKSCGPLCDLIQSNILRNTCKNYSY